MSDKVNEIAERELPKFESGHVVGGTVVKADVHGILYRINAEHGTIRKVKWEPET